MPVQNKFNKARRYRARDQKEKFQKYSPVLTGFLFLLIGVNYFVLAIRALGKGESFCFLAAAFIFAAYVAAFVMLRSGIAHETIYRNSVHARAPRFPLKTIAGGLLAVASFLSAYLLGHYTLFASLALGVSVLAGWYLYYGFDPRKDKLEGFESNKTAERVMKLIIDARDDIGYIKKTAASVRDEEIRLPMLKMAEGFERIVKHIEEDPDDYDRARRYLVSYLGDLRTMSETYFKLESAGRADEIRMTFLQTLEESTGKLDRQYDKLLDDDVLNLDIQIAVLKKRLESEG